MVYSGGDKSAFFYLSCWLFNLKQVLNFLNEDFKLNLKNFQVVHEEQVLNSLTIKITAKEK